MGTGQSRGANVLATVTTVATVAFYATKYTIEGVGKLLKLVKLVGDEQVAGADNIAAPLTEKQRYEKVKQYQEQSPEKNSLKSNNIYWPDNVWNQLKNSNSISDSKFTVYLSRYVYEEVPLPAGYFNYTNVILFNRQTQGLMHSFARHNDQWEEFIPELNVLTRRLHHDVVIALQKIKDEMQENSENMQVRYVELENAIESSPNPLGNNFYYHVLFMIINSNHSMFQELEKFC